MHLLPSQMKSRDVKVFAKMAGFAFQEERVNQHATAQRRGILVKDAKKPSAVEIQFTKMTLRPVISFVMEANAFAAKILQDPRLFVMKARGR
jgi:hypothetical protein